MRLQVAAGRFLSSMRAAVAWRRERKAENEQSGYRHKRLSSCKPWGLEEESPGNTRWRFLSLFSISRFDSDFDYTLSALTKELIGLCDPVERERVRQKWSQIQTSLTDQFQ